MIKIIGDTPDELADFQDVIDTGMLNTNNKEISFDIGYELSSGDKLLFNNYNHIIGSIPLEEVRKVTSSYFS